MKTNILLFTQTMHSLLSSCLTLQNSLTICKEILSGKTERKLLSEILKKVKDGQRLSKALLEQKDFSHLYISLVSIGEESGTLSQVFGHLSSYLKDKQNVHKKITQALLYPALVLTSAIIVVVILTVFVMPCLESIFEAFSGTSEDIVIQMNKIKERFIVYVITGLVFIVIIILCAAAHKINHKAAYIIDSILLKLPIIKSFVMTMQMYDFSFAMKLLTQTHYPLIQSLNHSKEVLRNMRIEKAVDSVCQNIAFGKGIGESFENEKLFPKYITVWVKIAEENGHVEEAFNQICSYYQNESENILTGITQAAEPVFILVTGAIIIAIIAEFVVPVFNLMGAL